MPPPKLAEGKLILDSDAWPELCIAFTGLFSGLNNLTDITLWEKYATICGYTESVRPK
jgi:hypothetical protein